MSRRSARLTLLFSCVGHFYIHLFTAFYFVIALSLESVWQRPYHELIELWTLGSLLVGLAALPAGWLGDRWSATGMMILFFIGMGGASIVAGLVDGPTALLVALSALGLFAAIYHPVGIAWLVRNAEARGKALGFNGIFGAVGVAAAGLVAGTLIDLFSWRAAFIVPGIVCVATGIVLLICVRAGIVVEGETSERAEATAAEGDRLRGLLILLFTMFCLGLVFQATQAAVPKVFDLRLRDLAGEGAFGIGALVAGVYTVGGVMQVFGGYLADRLPLKRVYLLAFLIQVPVLSGIAVLSGVPLVAIAALSVLLATGALPAENMLLANYTPAHRRSLAYGVKYVLALGAAPIAIWLTSQVQARTGDFVWLFLLLAGMTGAAFIAATLLPGERKPAPTTAAQPAE